MSNDPITILGPGEEWPPTRPAPPLPRPLPKLQTIRPGWEYITEGGTWGLERLEQASTPWDLIHLATMTVVSQHGSLDAARRQILEIEGGNYSVTVAGVTVRCPWCDSRRMPGPNLEDRPDEPGWLFRNPLCCPACGGVGDEFDWGLQRTRDQELGP